MERNKEELALIKKQAYLDGQLHDELIKNLENRITKFGDAFLDSYRINMRLKYIDVESTQKNCLQIKDIERKYLGIVNHATIDLIKTFEEDHKYLCEYLADLEDKGTWIRRLEDLN